jgi:hypothetical protein
MRASSAGQTCAPTTEMHHKDDAGKMWRYRALASLIDQSFEKGDIAMAPSLCRILDDTWHSIDGDNLAVKNRELFKKIDEAMGTFIAPITWYQKQPPERAKVEKSYKEYLEALKAAD